MPQDEQIFLPKRERATPSNYREFDFLRENRTCWTKACLFSTCRGTIQRWQFIWPSDFRTRCPSINLGLPREFDRDGPCPNSPLNRVTELRRQPCQPPRYAC